MNFFDGRYDMNGIVFDKATTGNAYGPLNINVSYNAPPEQMQKPSFQNQMYDFLKNANMADIGRFQFSSGLEPQKKKHTASSETLLSPVNSMTQNAALSNLNQSYYPAYLQNPLNEEQPGTHIDSIFDKNRLHQKIIKKQVETNEGEDRKALLSTFLMQF